MKKFRKAIFVVTYYIKDSKPVYLILKRKLHWKGWEFPKGGIDLFESKKNAVIREVKEETGLNVLNIQKHNKHGKYLYKKKFLDRTGIAGQTYSLYSAKVKKTKVKIDKKEHTEYQWLNFNKAIKIITHSNQRKCLRIVNDWLKNDSLQTNNT